MSNTKKALDIFKEQLEDIRKAGTWREERVITTPQMSRINTTQSQGVLNLCANNYLGLSNDYRVIQAARNAYDSWGFGLSVCALSAAHSSSTNSWSSAWPISCRWMMSSCIPPA